MKTEHWVLFVDYFYIRKPARSLAGSLFFDGAVGGDKRGKVKEFLEQAWASGVGMGCIVENKDDGINFAAGSCKEPLADEEVELGDESAVAGSGG